MKKTSAKNSGLRHAATMLKRHSQGNDTILAHISPEEARYMEEHFGSDINPHTGLPQYGLFSRLFGRRHRHEAPSYQQPMQQNEAPQEQHRSRGFFKRLERGLRRPFKMLAPIAGSLVGGMLGGPAGAIAGGALGGGLTSRHHMVDHALGGAALGLGHGLISPMIGRGLGLNPDSMLGRASMMGADSLGEQLGLGGAGAAGLGSLFGGGNGSGSGEGSNSTQSGMGGLGGALSALGGLGGTGSLLDTALLATTVAGTLGARSRVPELGTTGNETLQQAMQQNRHTWGPEDQAPATPPVHQREQAKFPPKAYRGSQWKFFPTPEEQEEQLRRVNAEIAEPGYESRYAKGGSVEGYYDGNDGGQDDTIPVDLPEKSYIMDATTVSLVGDGNSKHGARKIKKLVDNFEKTGFVKDYKPSRNIKAMVSDGELYLSPKEVAAAGGGSIDKGVKTLDKFRKNIRKHKGVKKFLPPKSKPLNQYLR